VAQVPAGEPFNSRQSRQIQDAVTHAIETTGLRFAVFIGPAEGSDVHQFAKRSLAALGLASDLGVVVVVDPGARRVEIVTGKGARLRLDDRSAGLASLSMATSFAGGDLAGGLANGLRMLAQSATRPRVLHEHDAE
jgi:uncharacterized membrane protein YgcG